MLDLQAMAEDITFRWEKEHRQYTDQDVINQLKLTLNDQLNYRSKSLENYDIEMPPEDWARLDDDSKLASIKIQKLSSSIDNQIDINQLNLEIGMLTDEQKSYFNLFTSAIESNTGGMYFIDGPGGYGCK